MSAEPEFTVHPAPETIKDRYHRLHDGLLVIDHSDGTQMNLSQVIQAERYLAATGHRVFGLLITQSGERPLSPVELMEFTQRHFRVSLKVAWLAETEMGYRCLNVAAEVLDNIEGRVFRSSADAIRWLRLALHTG